MHRAAQSSYGNSSEEKIKIKKEITAIDKELKQLSQ